MTLRNKWEFPPVTSMLFTYLTSAPFIEKLSTFVGIPLIEDIDRNFWDIHVFENGDYLDMHVDAGEYHGNGLKKEVTLGIYLSSNWKDEYGGELEIWDGTSSHSDHAYLTKRVVKVNPVFNRAVIFSCTDNSWHGAPEPVSCPDGAKRIFLTLSYLSERKDHLNKRRKAFFVGTPENPYDDDKRELALPRANPATCKSVYNRESQ